ncbi:CpaD family pilus assembly protein [Ensifer soli]|uniref:CpaD family pilus assembly protein n=1 Tax=Ciceribacter sp. sgz301302 TaxID=3342379 RepID=UPI0035B85594
MPSRLAPNLAVAALLALSAAVTGCANPDRIPTGSLPDDYRTRHPIMIAEAEHSIDIPISAGDAKLQQGTRDTIRGFAQKYRNDSSGAIQIVLPDGSPNAGTAHRLSKDIRAVLVGTGIPSHRVIVTSYAASVDGASSPVRLSYVAITAKTGPCGEWPDDLAYNTYQNKNWQNFGCASQSNLAAQIENPMDLIGPREMSPPDAQQRLGVINKDYRGETSGDVSTININTN